MPEGKTKFLQPTIKIGGISPYLSPIFLGDPMIYIIFAPPRTGKTYLATKWALEIMKKGKKKVISNYPIYDPKLGSSLKWEQSYASSDALVDSFVIFDEAYMYFNSRNFKNFTADEHTMFATNGHNNNDFVLIAHSPQRLDTVIREMVNTYFYVKKFQLPLMKRPLWFKVEGYIDELSLSQRYTNKNSVYSVERYLFSKKVANAYDTHFFKKAETEIIKFEEWVKPDNSKPKYSVRRLVSSCLELIKLRTFRKNRNINKDKTHTFISLHMIGSTLNEGNCLPNMENGLIEENRTKKERGSIKKLPLRSGIIARLKTSSRNQKLSLLFLIVLCYLSICLVLTIL